jgi:hypothetical protein
MSVYKLRCFGNPEALRKLSFDNLMLLLSKFDDYFKLVNFPIPKDTTEETFNYDSLASTLLCPMFDLETGLFDALLLIDAMSKVDFFDILAEHIIGKSYAQPITKDMSAGDLALLIYLNEPEVLKKINDRVNMKDPQSFSTFTGVKRFENWEPSNAHIQELQRIFNHSFLAHGRGETVRISKFKKGKEFCFLIRKGEPLSRHGAIIPGYEETRNLICQLESFDVVVFNPETGRLRITIGGLKSVWMKTEYPRMFGRALFGDYEFFIDQHLYNFEAIRKQDKSFMVWKDFPQILDIRLSECVIAKEGANNVKRTYKADDVFLDWESDGTVLGKSDIFMRVKFKVLFTDKKQKTFTLYNDNRSGYKYDNYAMTFEDWLIARKILAVGLGEELHEEIELFVA